MLRKLTGGERRLEVAGATLGEVIESLEARYPGVRARLLEGGELRRGIAAAVDSVIASRGLRQEVPAGAEVTFIPAVSGG
jgi:molybdopterin converting factor small subunit